MAFTGCFKNNEKRIIGKLIEPVNQAEALNFVQQDIDNGKDFASIITLIEQIMNTLKDPAIKTYDLKNELTTIFEDGVFRQRLISGIGQAILDKATKEMLRKNKNPQEKLHMIMNCIALNELWTTYPVAIKRCLDIAYKDSTVEIGEIFDSSTAKKNIDECKLNIKCFNEDRGYWNPNQYIAEMLHKRHKSKKRNTQKKNISRVNRTIRCWMLIYASLCKDGRFSNERHTVPNKFTTGIKEKFFPND